MTLDQKIKVYMICRISKDAHSWNEQVFEAMTEPLEAFMPHQHNPYNLAHEKIPLPVVETDMHAMQGADIGLALPEFGRDCAFETGWFAHSEKTLVYLVDDQTTWLRDWMIKGGLDYVVTTNPETYKILKDDGILSRKPLILIDSLSDLTETLVKIYQEAHA